jgi:hypothetical protein
MPVLILCYIRIVSILSSFFKLTNCSSDAGMPQCVLPLTQSNPIYEVIRSLDTNEGPGCRIIENSELCMELLSLGCGEQLVGSVLRDQGTLLLDFAFPTISLRFLSDIDLFTNRK